MRPDIHSSTIYNNQDMETTYMSINRWMDKEDVIHTYHGILLNHKKKLNNAIPFVATWMDLEIIVLSKISQTNAIWCHSGGIKKKKKDTKNLSMKHKQIHRHRKQTYNYQKEKEGKG